MGNLDISGFREIYMKKIVGILIIVLIILLSILNLFFANDKFFPLLSLAYNMLTVFCILIWIGFIRVSQQRRKLISIILWWWLFWDSIFESIKILYYNLQ